MKKFLSAALAAIMLLALCAALAVPASAIDGEWIVYSKADYYVPNYEGDIMSIPGYEYNAEGLRILSADWRDFRPGAGMQTKEKLDIKEGVYMKVRIDEFNYEDDHWFNFHIYSRQPMKAGKTDKEKWGYGVQELIRYKTGKFTIEWAIDAFSKVGSIPIDAANISKDENGVVTLEFEVKYNGSSFAVSINNTPAPQAVIDYMNKTYAAEDAYVGFNFQNNTKGGKCGCTLLAFGTSKEDATIPMGDDSRAPENFYTDVSAIADPSTVAAGQPAIFMNGSRTESDSKMAPTAGGGTATVNEDYSVHVVAATSGPYLNFNVKNTVSFNIKDFPIAMVMTKDFCTCGEESCYAIESANMYLLTDETIGASASCKINELEMSYEPYVIDGHSYLYFFTDANDAPFEATGRINGARFDFMGVDANTAGKNALDVCFAAFFRNVDEATAFAESYLTALGWEKETQAPAVDTTEAPAAETTEAPAVDTTEAPAVDTTEAPEVETTEAPAVDTPIEGTDAPATGDKEPAKSGCGSVVGFGAIAMIAVAAVAGVVSFKKED